MEFVKIPEEITKGAVNMALKEMPKIGDKVQYLGGYFEEGDLIEVGDVFTIVGRDIKRTAYFYSEGRKWYIEPIHYSFYDIVSESNPDVTDLIANLAHRVQSLELERVNREHHEMVADNNEPPKAEEIRQACDSVRDLLIRKNHDYGDSFAQQYAKYGLQSALIRMDDKMRRLETLADGAEAQVAESIEDTLADLAGYALLALVEARK